ncbi:Glycosyl hydrolases family 28 [Phytophthora infestans]|uniref:endo-polygalacturonase n=1 Tax=Phytophthora infestans TaxID=4787 RepID=A0A833S5G7_PHYIN|nr:Glycosyl hydrolases family 28 [Phytophthora infestans]
MPTSQRLDEWPQSFAGNSYRAPKVLEAGAVDHSTRVLPSAERRELDPVGLYAQELPVPHVQHCHVQADHAERLTLDSSAGNGLAKNTDGFDLTKNDHITITGNKIYNQDDCLAMQSSTSTVFSNNLCCGGHGVSIGSLGGNAVDQSSTVQGLTVQGNTIQNSDNGIRIKTIVGLKGLVSNVKYVDNKLQNVKNAIVMHSDYSKAKGGYTGSPTSAVTIEGVTISGLTGSATNLYDIVANPKVVSGWTFSGIKVSASQTGKAVGQTNSVSV